MDAKLTLTPPINDCDSISSPLLSELVLLLFPLAVDEKSEPRESPKPDDAEGFQDADIIEYGFEFGLLYVSFSIPSRFGGVYKFKYQLLNLSFSAMVYVVVVLLLLYTEAKSEDEIATKKTINNPVYS